MKHLRLKIMTILCLPFLLYACSFGSTLYNNFDYVVLWKVSDYVRLTKQQKQEFSRASNVFIEWHRQHELPQYHTLIKQLQQDLAGQTLTHKKAQTYQTNLKNYRNNVVDYLQIHIPPLLTDFTEQQYQQFLTNLTEQINERNQLSDDERKAELTERWEKWYKKLTVEQEKVIDQLHKKRQKQRQVWASNTDVWLETLEQAIQINTYETAQVKAQKVSEALWSILAISSSQNYSELEEIMQLWLKSNESQKQHLLEELADIEAFILACLDE